nr:MAG TPA: hypothetical protein [Caudoviricetes sp.]
MILFVYLLMIYELLLHHPKTLLSSNPNSLYRDYSPGKTLGFAFSI